MAAVRVVVLAALAALAQANSSIPTLSSTTEGKTTTIRLATATGAELLLRGTTECPVLEPVDCPSPPPPAPAPPPSPAVIVNNNGGGSGSCANGGEPYNAIQDDLAALGINGTVWLEMAPMRAPAYTSPSMDVLGFHLEGPSKKFYHPKFLRRFACNFENQATNEVASAMGKVALNDEYYEINCAVPSLAPGKYGVSVDFRASEAIAIPFKGAEKDNVYESFHEWTDLTEEVSGTVKITGVGFFTGRRYLCTYVELGTSPTTQFSRGVAKSNTLIDCGKVPTFPEQGLLEDNTFPLKLTVSDEQTGEEVPGPDIEFHIIADSCKDTETNHHETDTNCGGKYCDPCEDGKTCVVDDDCKSTYCEPNTKKCVADLDGDGYTVGQGDCDDNNPAIHPGATEIADGLDNNCDGQAKDGDYTGQTLSQSAYEFNTFNVGNGATVTPSSSNPVRVFVLGAATIAGTINLAGGDGENVASNWGVKRYPGGVGGPAGGYAGGEGGQCCGSPNGDGSDGKGPGGGKGTIYGSTGPPAGGAGHASVGTKGKDMCYACGSPCYTGGAGGPAYGTTWELTPGSGGGGAGAGGGVNNDGSGGGGGGGAFEINAKTIDVTASGKINANGGRAGDVACGRDGGHGGGGSGGTIWLRALDKITVQAGATLTAVGGRGGTNNNAPNCRCNDDGGQGSNGKILVGAHAHGTSKPVYNFQPGATTTPSPTVDLS